MPEVARIIGGAGTGKTTFLLEKMERALDAGGYAPHQIGFISFTRAARSEAAERAAAKFNVSVKDLEERGWFRTIHSACYRLLRGQCGTLLADSAEDRAWLREHLHEEINGVEGEESEGFQKRTPAEIALAMWSAARNRLVPLREVYDRAHVCDDRLPDFAYINGVVHKYQQAKRLDNRADFTDLIGLYAGYWFTPEGATKVNPLGEIPDVPVWYLDEQQDTSALLDAACRRLTSNARWVYMCLDPFQCQPAGTVVQTTGGPKLIEDLAPATDRLVCFDRSAGEIRNRDGYAFRIAHRHCDSGEVLRITTTDGQVMHSTFNHKWLCRLDRSVKEKHCVYLMRRGDRWRIGMCQLITENPGRNGSFRLGQRCRLEKADAAWILSVHDTRKAAAIAETVAQVKFGLPGTTFQPPSCKNTFLTTGFIDAVFAALGNQRQAALRCLASHKLSPAYPHWKAGEKIKRGFEYLFEIQACNLIPGCMLIPKMNDDHKTVTWTGVRAVEVLSAGDRITVYSLDVEKFHNYVADGHVTCNSIYGWAGASAAHAMAWDVQKQHVLPRSYRCPRLIHELGEQVLSTCSDYWNRGIAPAPREGSIEEVLNYEEGWPERIDPAGKESWLLIARTNYAAQKLARRMDGNGIPWLPTKPGGCRWDAPVRNEAIRALRALQDGFPITATEWQSILKKVSKAGLFTRGTKTEWEKYTGDPNALQDLTGLATWGATPALRNLIKSKNWVHLLDFASDYTKAVDKFGYDAVLNPRVRVGTIHSVKGAEADNVVLFTATGPQIARGLQFQDQFDEERRVCYVGVTRARERLIVVRPSGSDSYHMDLSL